MNRSTLLLLLCLIAGVTFAQTYVRPSKGKSFEPFVDGGASDYAGTGASTWTMYPAVPADGGVFTATSSPYDWTAFSGLQLYLTIDYSNPGTFDYQQKLTYSELGSYVRFKVAYGGNANPGFSIVAQESDSPSGPFVDIQEQPTVFAVVSYTSGPRIRVSVTPVPFSAPKTGASTTSSTPVDIRGTTPDCSMRASTSWYGQGGAAYSDPSYALELSSIFFPVRSGTAQYPNSQNPSNRVTVRACNAADNAFNYAYCFDAKTYDPDLSPLWLAVGNGSVPPWNATTFQNVLKYVSPITPGQCVEFYWNGRIFTDSQVNDVYCLASPETRLTADLCLH